MRAAKLLLRLCLGLALVAGTGCRRDGEPSSDEAQTEDDEHRFAPEAPAIAEAPVVPWELELVEAGAEPRRQLRYASQAPARELVVSTGMFHAKTDAQGEARDKLRFITRLKFTWRGVEAEGERRRYLFEVIGLLQGPGDWPEVARDPAEKRVAAGIETLFVGVRGQAEGTAQGIERLWRTRGIGSLDPEPAELLELFSVPLPAEAIGEGARWTLSHRYDLSAPQGPGMRTLFKPGREQTWRSEERSYRVRSIEGDRLVLELEGRVELDGVERVRSQGELELELDDPLARHAHIDLTHRSIPPPQYEGEWPEELPETKIRAEIE